MTTHVKIMNLFVKLGIVAAIGSAVFAGLSGGEETKKKTTVKKFASDINKVQNVIARVTSLVTSFVVISNNVTNLLSNGDSSRSISPQIGGSISRPTTIF